MKLWIDDVRPAPNGYVWCRTTDIAIQTIIKYSNRVDWDNNLIDEIELIDIDHDAGDFAQYGGDYIKVLEWLEDAGRSYPIHIHSMNPVGIQNMRAIIEHNGWKEI